MAVPPEQATGINDVLLIWPIVLLRLEAGEMLNLAGSFSLLQSGAETGPVNEIENGGSLSAEVDAWGCAPGVLSCH